MNICMVAHFAYGALTGGSVGHVGGVERQVSLSAKWLVDKGHDVSVITWNEGGSAEEMIDGVRVITICHEDDGIPVIRFIYPRWTSLIKALAKADADLYYHNCGEYVTGQIALWCKRRGRKFVYSVANDMECDPELSVMPTLREKILYKYGIQHADKVISQTYNQYHMLKTWLGLESVVMPMPCPGPSKNELDERSFSLTEQKSVLWVARIHSSKRLELLLDIAEKLPDIQFNVAGKPGNENEYIEALIVRAQKIKNVNLMGMVVREKMPELYLSADVLCCTSAYEGFPNTFLEAWSYGLPIVSTFDPDGLIDKERLGRVVSSVEEAVKAIKLMLSDGDAWCDMSRRARNYYLNNHEVDCVMTKFEAIFKSVLT